jgi:hypothetical protein
VLNGFKLRKDERGTPADALILIPQKDDSLTRLGAATMDGLTVLVVAIGSLLLALVAYLGAVDYIDPVPERADGFSPNPMSKRRREKESAHRLKGRSKVRPAAANHGSGSTGVLTPCPWRQSDRRQIWKIFCFIGMIRSGVRSRIARSQRVLVPKKTGAERRRVTFSFAQGWCLFARKG